jgi:hypothetical protein
MLAERRIAFVQLWLGACELVHLVLEVCDGAVDERRFLACLVKLTRAERVHHECVSSAGGCAHGGYSAQCMTPGTAAAA